MADSETLEQYPQSKKKAKEIADEAEMPKKNNRDDLGNMATDFFGCINFKIAIFLFVFGIFIFSDLFIENVLCKIKDATHADTATTKGTMIQLLVFVLFYLVIDLLIQGGII